MVNFTIEKVQKQSYNTLHVCIRHSISCTGLHIKAVLVNTVQVHLGLFVQFIIYSHAYYNPIYTYIFSRLNKIRYMSCTNSYVQYSPQLIQLQSFNL